MLGCGHCLAWFPDVNSLIIHLKRNCNNLPPLSNSGTGYKCGQGCFEKFDSLNTLRMHLKRVHFTSTTVKNTNVISEQLLPALNATTTSTDCCDDASKFNEPGSSFCSESQREQCPNKTIEESHDTESDCNLNKQFLITETALMVSSFLADPLVPRSIVKLFVKSMASYVSNLMPLLLQNCNEINVDKMLSQIPQTVQDFSSEHRWNKYFRDLGTYIEPEEYRTTTEPRAGIIKGKRKQILETGQFIPLRRVLHKFLIIPGILKSIDEYVECCLRLKVVTNVVRTSIWINTIHSLDDDVKIYPLFLYYDDYETGNPLGSHANVHKLGAVYASIACLPPNLASQLKYIFLVALFNSSDRTREEGNFNCFQKVIDELNFLSGTGIDITIPGYFQGRIKFQLVSLIGDNLGLHSILGFVENFTANYPCRFCRAYKTEIKTMCTEELSLLRNESNYISDLHLQNPSQTGIKEESLWRQVDGFDMFKHASVDLMHDILEGVVRYAMKEVLKGLFSKKYFNLQELNNRIALFNYGPDSNCKPPQICMESGLIVKWKMSAMEAFNFIRYFPCFVSHKVPYEDQHWELYLLLRKLLDMSMTEAVYPEICDEIRDTVNQFNSLYVLLSKSHLKPKFHHLIHYPGIMEKLGPLHNLWSMRYEAKHRISKICARASSNRINLPKTLAIRHQLQLNHLFLKNRIDYNVEPSTCRKKVDVATFDLLSSQLDLPCDLKLFSISFITINGIRYEPKHILALEIDKNSGEPDFIQISDIFYDNNTNKVFFEGLFLENHFFDPHVCSYCVSKTNVKKYVSYDSIAFLKPNNLTKLPPHDWCYYVIVRNSFY